MNPRLSEAVLHNAELNIREMKEKKTVLSSMPYKIFVEPTQRCNLRCFMCWNERRQIRDDLDLTLFETIEKTLFPLAAEVDFFLVGEPLLAKHFPVMIESAERHTFVPKIFTNALIYKNDIYRRLIELGFFVNISMDAASKRLYDRIRIGGDYEVFQANVRRIMARAEAMANPRFHVRICATIGSYNVSEVRGIVEFAREVGIRDVMVNDCDMGPPHPHNMCNMREEARVMLGECLALASEHRIRFSFPRYIGGEVLLEKNHNWDDFRLPIDDHAPDFLERYNPVLGECPYPWIETVVRCDGTVAACCQKLVEMGNLAKQPFEKIWNNRRYRSLRKQKQFYDCQGFCLLASNSVWRGEPFRPPRTG